MRSNRVAMAQKAYETISLPIHRIRATTAIAAEQPREDPQRPVDRGRSGRS